MFHMQKGVELEETYWHTNELEIVIVSYWVVDEASLAGLHP